MESLLRMSLVTAKLQDQIGQMCGVQASTHNDKDREQRDQAVFGRLHVAPHLQQLEVAGAHWHVGHTLADAPVEVKPWR
jgi:hypothetical protein